jgi:Uma2 family endonuclease
MEIQIPNRFVTPEEYLALELLAEYKNEYLDGKILPMTSHSIDQNGITVDCMCSIADGVEHEEWFVFTSSFKIRIDQPRCYFYPEISICKGKPNVVDNQYAYTNPTVVVEVLAEWSESFDRGKKFHRYKQIPSLTEYILIAQDEYQIDVFQKAHDGIWQLRSYSRLEDVLEIKSLKLSLPLADIYRRVKLGNNA